MLLKAALCERPFMLCIDETRDKKKGTTTDYTARQYIGNLGKAENSVVPVNAYGVLDTITFPLLFKIFKPEKCLKEDDVYRTKPELAIELIPELRVKGFVFEVVLADRLYGESGPFIEALLDMKLSFVVSGTGLNWVLRAFGAEGAGSTIARSKGQGSRQWTVRKC